ncbi:MAG TPA: FmdB family zinc ribbon protein [Vicinamibacteria bacterium]
MPIYEYRCTKCGHRFESIQKVSDPPLTKCEKCKGKVERLISSPAIQFKGSGWYITDYARKGSSGASDSSSTSGESSSSESSPETTGGKKKKKEKEKAGSSK